VKGPIVIYSCAMLAAFGMTSFVFINSLDGFVRDDIGSLVLVHINSLGGVL
jgi:hypothetical protein